MCMDVLTWGYPTGGNPNDLPVFSDRITGRNIAQGYFMAGGDGLGNVKLRGAVG